MDRTHARPVHARKDIVHRPSHLIRRCRRARDAVRHDHQRMSVVATDAHDVGGLDPHEVVVVHVLWNLTVMAPKPYEAADAVAGVHRTRPDAHAALPRNRTSDATTSVEYRSFPSLSCHLRVFSFPST